MAASFSPSPNSKPVSSSLQKTLFLLGLLAIFIFLPVGFAAATGEAETGMVGLTALGSRIESVYCQTGISPFTTVWTAATVLVLVATALALARPNRMHWSLSALREQGVYLAVLFLLIAVPFIIAWQTDSSVCTRGKSYFWQSVYIEVFILAALAISYNLIFGFTGVVSFGHAAFFGVGAYGVGLLILHLGWPLGLAIVATLLISVLMGLFVSAIALRIRGLYFAIFTLAFAEIFFILAQNRILTKITGAEDGFTFPVPDWINATRERLTFYYLALAFLVFCFLLVRQLINSPTGRVLRGIRENEDRAMMLGFNTFAFKTIAIVLASVMAAGAGILRGLLNKGASPNVLGIGFTMDPLLMTLIGGVGTFAGPVVGAFLLRFVEQSLRDTILTFGSVTVNIGERWALLLGVLFILIVMVFPSGIVGTIRSNWLRWKHERRARAKPSLRDEPT